MEVGCVMRIAALRVDCRVTSNKGYRQEWEAIPWTHFLREWPWMTGRAAPRDDNLLWQCNAVSILLMSAFLLQVCRGYFSSYSFRRPHHIWIPSSSYLTTPPFAHKASSSLDANIKLIPMWYVKGHLRGVRNGRDVGTRSPHAVKVATKRERWKTNSQVMQ